jgi:hypothetical protein
MKRIIAMIVFVAILAFPAFSQIRLDIGVDVPMQLWAVGGGEIRSDSDIGEFLRQHIFPIPEASLYYQFDLGPLRLAPGVRAFTLIFESMVWPNLMAELAFDPVYIQAQLGGLIFLFFGLGNQVEYGEVFFPDLSIWIGLGKERRFRLGGGFLGMYWPDLTTEGIGVIPYVGGKVSLLF